MRAKVCVHCGAPDTWNLFCSTQCELDFWRPRRHGEVQITVGSMLDEVVQDALSSLPPDQRPS